MSKMDDVMFKRMFSYFVDKRLRAPPGHASPPTSPLTSQASSGPQAPSNPQLRRTNSAHPRAPPSHAYGTPGHSGGGNSGGGASSSHGGRPSLSGAGPSSSTGAGGGAGQAQRSLPQLLAPQHPGGAPHPHHGQHAPYHHSGHPGAGPPRRRAASGSIPSDTEPALNAASVRPPRKRTRTTDAALARTRSAHASTGAAPGHPAGPLQHAHPGMPDGNVSHRTSGGHLPSHVVNAHGHPSGQSGSESHVPAARSFPCEICGSVFAQKGQLSRHQRRVHEKLRPHACEYCGRLFGARSDRTRHVQIVHKKEPR